MAITDDIGTLIVRTPGTCGGRPRIKGTRITVRNIVTWWRLGLSPESLFNNVDREQWDMVEHPYENSTISFGLDR